MARQFAVKFYNSKEWKQFRQAYYDSHFGICEKCGNPGEEVHHTTFLNENNIDDPDITLNQDKVMLLCRECHRAEHDNAAMFKRMNLIRGYHKGDGLTTFKDGQLVRNYNVTIVYGAPSSGKTTYINENKGRYDLVIDLDYIRRALELSANKRHVYDTLPIALDVRDYIYDMIASRAWYFEHCWIVAGLPKKQERMALVNKLQAKLYHVDTDEDECVERAKEDKELSSITTQIDLIHRYFSELEA